MAVGAVVVVRLVVYSYGPFQTGQTRRHLGFIGVSPLRTICAVLLPGLIGCCAGLARVAFDRPAQRTVRPRVTVLNRTVDFRT